MDNIFEKWLFEADEPPDIDMSNNDETNNENTPDIPDDASSTDGPPDIDTDFGNDMPDMDNTENDDFQNNDFEDIDEANPDDENKVLELDDKVSAILNNRLYQRYLSMLNNIGSQITIINNNSDVLFTLISDEYSEYIKHLKKLDENIRLYLKNNFINENYSKNLLFFNKCSNLLKLLNDSFDEKIKKGVKAIN